MQHRRLKVPFFQENPQTEKKLNPLFAKVSTLLQMLIKESASLSVCNLVCLISWFQEMCFATPFHLQLPLQIKCCHTNSPTIATADKILPHQFTYHCHCR